MDTIKIIANGFGILSTLCFIISFQVKSNKKLFIIQAVANVFYGTQFYLLGATGGLFNMGMQIVRNIFLCKKKEWKWVQHILFPIAFCVPSIIYALFVWHGPIDFLPLIAMIVGTFACWSDNAKIIRVAELVCICPAWMSYDFISGAYGGVLNELVILGSVIASIIRFGWKGLDEVK